jgi:hypothetical protein
MFLHMDSSGFLNPIMAMGQIDSLQLIHRPQLPSSLDLATCNFDFLDGAK